MGIFTCQVTVSDVNESQSALVEAMVDTGSSYTLIPQSILHELGIRPERMRGFRLANGERVEYPVALARLRVDGQAAGSQVVFGPDDVQPLLGAVALQELNMAVDTPNEQLVPGPELRL